MRDDWVAIQQEEYNKAYDAGLRRAYLELKDALGSVPPNDAKRPGLEWAVKDLARLGADPGREELNRITESKTI